MAPPTSPRRSLQINQSAEHAGMTLPGSPLPPRSCLNRGTRSATTTPEMEMLRRRVWQQQGVVSLHLEDITDPWLRQAIQNEAVRRWGPRQKETNHGR